MDALWNSDLRWVPAMALMVLGAALVVRAELRQLQGRRMPFGTPGKTLKTMEWMRLVLGGGSLIAIGAGWWFHVPFLVAAGAVIGFEETIETSIAASALKEEKERDEAALRRGAQHG
ncbi:MAG: hypothetical protein ACM3S1_08725 [Hyphomicrobiales bacterium]